MFKLSKYLKVFTVLVFLYSVCFNYAYHNQMTPDQWFNFLKIGIIYGVTIFLTGLLLGMRDPVKSSRVDQGFQYHLMTFIVVNVTYLIWPLLFYSAFESSVQLDWYIQLILITGWGLGLLGHYLLSRKTIKGIPTDEVFD